MAGEPNHPEQAPAGIPSRRAFYFNGGFLTNARVRRILTLAGHDLRLGKPSETDDVLVWGHSPTAPRGEAMAASSGAHIVRVEDAFLRSLQPGRSGEPPLGLTIDRRGAWFDATQASDLEHLLSTHPLDDSALLDRARTAIDRMCDGHLTKYAAVDPALPAPDPGYVLVIDQTKGDASISLGGAKASTFREMLVIAQEENPGARIVIKTHPETREGHREGHYGHEHAADHIQLVDTALSPWTLMAGAISVYTVSSQLGFEAILAGHRPRVFGQPFYAGWDLSDDRVIVPRRQRKLTRAQLFAGVMILFPVWYDPYRDRLCELETVLATLEARARAWREDRAGYVAIGMRSWKRGHLQKIFGAQGTPIRFARDPETAIAHARPVLVWSSQETDALHRACATAGVPLIRVEDGFLRSCGLGANLIPPLSLVKDDLGIYYDPTRENRLEHLITAAADLPFKRLDRAERLIDRIVTLGLSKYNLSLSAQIPDTNGREVVVVPGQVEDDASILRGASDVKTNLALLQAARARHPDAFMIYKPHPDVEAGLRAGMIPADVLADMADFVATQSDPVALLSIADHVVTMTSGLGFEALLRGCKVTTLGTPFYAGWGLTTDLSPTPARRRARPSLASLVEATLIQYPRYYDPVTGTACPVEVVLDRLADGTVARASLRLRLLSKIQGQLASFAWLWR